MSRFILTLGLSIMSFILSCAPVKNDVTKSKPVQITDTVTKTTVNGIDFEFVKAIYDDGLLTVTLTATSNNKDRVIAIFKNDTKINYYVNYKPYHKILRVALIDKNGNEYKPESIKIGSNEIEKTNDYGLFSDLCKNTLYEGTKTKIEFTFKIDHKIDVISLLTFDFYNGQYDRDKSPEKIYNVKLRNLKVSK